MANEMNTISIQEYQQLLAEKGALERLLTEISQDRVIERQGLQMRLNDVCKFLSEATIHVTAAECALQSSISHPPAIETAFMHHAATIGLWHYDALGYEFYPANMSSDPTATARMVAENQFTAWMERRRKLFLEYYTTGAEPARFGGKREDDVANDNAWAWLEWEKRFVR